jgi:hypothetical protein
MLYDMPCGGARAVSEAFRPVSKICVEQKGEFPRSLLFKGR